MMKCLSNLGIYLVHFIFSEVHINGLFQKIVRKSRILRIFTEIRILHVHLSDFDDFFTIGSEFAQRTRFRTPFRADFVKNAVSENFCFRILRKFSENFRTIFRENRLLCPFKRSVKCPS